MVPSYEGKTSLKGFSKGYRSNTFKGCLTFFVGFNCFCLRPGSTVHCIYVFSLPQALVKTLAKNLVKSLARNQVKNLAKISSDKLINNSSKNTVDSFQY